MSDLAATYLHAYLRNKNILILAGVTRNAHLFGIASCGLPVPL